MLVYRVFPNIVGARPGQPGHPLYVHPDQGAGRWDNPDRYRMLYLATSPEAAVGEAFAHLSHWRQAMLAFPQFPGAQRVLGRYELDETAAPVLDLDDAGALQTRHLRPTEVVVRDRARTQAIARSVHDEGRWAGIAWWSMHRPQWRLLALWSHDAVRVLGVESLVANDALVGAAELLAKEVDPDLR